MRVQKIAKQVSPRNRKIRLGRNMNNADEKVEMAADIVENVPVVGKLGSTAIKIGAKIAPVIKKIVPGKVTADRFFATRKFFLTELTKAGYGDNDVIPMSKYKVHHDGVVDKKSNGTYEKEYERLRQYVIARLNHSNAGLGDYYATLRPQYAMWDKGGLADLPAIKKQFIDIVNTYPPNSYKPTFQEKNKVVSQNAINENQGKGGRLQATIARIKGKGEVESENVKKLKPLASVMTEGLQAAGHIAPKGVASLADEFYAKIVAPATANDYDSDHLDDSITDAILDFVVVLQQKKINGETLPTVYEKIASGTMAVQEKLESKQSSSGASILDWVKDHPLESAGIALALYLIARKLL